MTNNRIKSRKELERRGDDRDNYYYLLSFFDMSTFFSPLIQNPDFFLDFFSDFFLDFFPNFFSTFSSVSDQHFSRLSDRMKSKWRLSFLVFIATLTESAGVLSPYLPPLNLNNQLVE